MDIFDKQEDLDFERFSTFLRKHGNIVDIKRKSVFDSWDCEFTDNNTGLTWRVELKNRSFPSTHKLAKEGLILEESKLLTCTSNLTQPAMYVNMMSDGVFLVFILDKSLIEKTHPITMTMNYKTLANRGKKEKLVRLLKPELGEIYNI